MTTQTQGDVQGKQEVGEQMSESERVKTLAINGSVKRNGNGVSGGKQVAADHPSTIKSLVVVIILAVVFVVFLVAMNGVVRGWE